MRMHFVFDGSTTKSADVMFPVVDYVTAGRDYDGLSLTGYRRSSCYAAAAATGCLTNHHHENAGGRSSVGKSPRNYVPIQRTTQLHQCLLSSLFLN